MISSVLIREVPRNFDCGRADATATATATLQLTLWGSFALEYHGARTHERQTLRRL
jgi:hypothetical protein